MLERKTKLVLYAIAAIVGVQVAAFALLRWSRPRATASALVSPEPSLPPSSAVPQPPTTGVAEPAPVASSLLPGVPGVPGVVGAAPGAAGAATREPRVATSPLGSGAPGVPAIAAGRSAALPVVTPALATPSDERAPTLAHGDPGGVAAPVVVANAAVVEPPPPAPAPARSVEAPAPPTPKAPTPRTTAMGRADVGRGLFAARCTSCHALSPRHYSRAQWTVFFASGRHDRDERLGDRVTVAEIAAIHAYVDENAADSARDEGAGIR